MSFVVGLDWAATTHAVCVLDETGTVRWRGTVPHTAAGLADSSSGWPASRPPPRCPSPSSAPPASSSIPSWTPASRSSRSTPMP